MSKTAGRPAHQPTKETKDAVQLMAAAGVNHDAIATIVGISDETLRKHYATELEYGNSKVVAAVAGALVKRALGQGPDAVNAAKFFLERRGGEAWKVIERTENVHVIRDITDEPLSEKEWAAIHITAH